MSSTTRNATHELTVACPECGTDIRIEMVDDVTITDHAPDGIIEATCGECGAGFAVGFQRQGG
jgi:RNase P subunit RPR2